MKLIVQIPCHNKNKSTATTNTVRLEESGAQTNHLYPLWYWPNTGRRKHAPAAFANELK